jgi:tRNA (guanosine-2'-O-)-methyltransferase
MVMRLAPRFYTSGKMFNFLVYHEFMTKHDRHLLDHLAQFVSDHKKQFVDKVLNVRTRHITVVLEDVFQSQNASAVVRTCECMGIQDIHIVEQISKYEINPRVLKGANKWMSLHRYNDRTINNTEHCFEKLRHAGYKVLAADPSENGISIHDIEMGNDKIALVFGNELRGLSEYGLTNADQRIRIPMYGFTESLNLSVSVAICLNTLITKLHKTSESLYLSENDRDVLKLEWYRKIVRSSEIIEREFLRTIE